MREKYLSFHWNPYPTATPGSRRDRILRVDQGQIILLSGTKSKVDELTLAQWSGKIEEVLRCGDWIEIVDKEVRLLAPQMALPPLNLNIESHVEWIKFRDEVELHFKKLGFQKVETPSIVSCPGTEPHLDPIYFDLAIGSKLERRFFPTSPELHLKKVISHGFGPVFEIRSCFRNGEISPLHQPEFQMLEWYRPFSLLKEIQEDILVLISQFSELERRKVTYLTMADLFSKHLSFTLTPKTGQVQMRELAKKLKLTFKEEDSFDDLFGLIFVDQIEKHLKQYPYLFLSGYPPSQAALARLDEFGWGDRFEFYMNGIEIANAFHELNDPVLQRKRMLEDIELKKKLGKGDVPLDEEFLQFLESGMPPTSGVALGLERLFLALKKKPDLTKIRLFPVRI